MVYRTVSAAQYSKGMQFASVRWGDTHTRKKQKTMKQIKRKSCFYYSSLTRRKKGKLVVFAVAACVCLAVSQRHQAFLAFPVCLLSLVCWRKPQLLLAFENLLCIISTFHQFPIKPSLSAKNVLASFFQFSKKSSISCYLLLTTLTRT